MAGVRSAGGERDQPDVTVIVPTRNRAALVRRLLHQLVNIDDGLCYEVIVVDEGSSDDTPALLREMSDHGVRVVRHDVPVGLAAARNVGLRLAAADYVGWIDDDDLTAPDRLRRQLDALRSGAFEWSCAARVNVDDFLRVIGHARCPAPDDIARSLLRVNVIPTSGQGLLVRRDVALEVGGYDETLRAAEDWDFCIRLGLRSPPHLLDEPLVGYRAGATTMSTDTRLMDQSLRRVIDKHAVSYRALAVAPDWLAIHESLLDADLMTSRRRAMSRAARTVVLRPSLRRVVRLVAIVLAPRWVARRSAAQMAAKVPDDWRSRAEAWLADVPVNSER